MNFRRPRTKPNEDERILPLINVVFLLLIFFMVVGRLSPTDPFAVAPPVSASEGRAEAQDTTVVVTADGRIALDGAVVEEAALRRALADRVAAGTAGLVRVKADGAASATRVVAVMEVLREAGIEKLRLLTIAERR